MLCRFLQDFGIVQMRQRRSHECLKMGSKFKVFRCISTVFVRNWHRTTNIPGEVKVHSNSGGIIDTAAKQNSKLFACMLSSWAHCDHIISSTSQNSRNLHVWSGTFARATTKIYYTVNFISGWKKKQRKNWEKKTRTCLVYLFASLNWKIFHLTRWETQRHTKAFGCAPP